MPKSLSTNLYISQSQRRGIAIVLAIFLFYGVSRFFLINQWRAYTDAIYFPARQEAKPKDLPKGLTGKLDLNTANSEQLTQMGLPEKLSVRLIHYRDKIGGFREWKSVERTYGITKEQLGLLRQYSSINLATQKNQYTANYYKSGFYPKQKKVVPLHSLHPFDPNTIQIEDLDAMGIKPSIAKGIVNFRKSGFTYRKEEDLLKIYAMDEATFAEIKPFIKLEKRMDEAQSVKKQKETVINPVDINTATVESLSKLPGIGKYYSRLILNWRDKLGGFCRIEQIASTYHLPDSVFSIMKPFITFNTPPNRIDINKADAETLAKHFYIRTKEAKIIVAYRDNHGPYQTVEDILKTGAIDRSWLEKAGPYLIAGK